MKHIDGISLKDVQDVYSGPEGRLWELVMGQQIHVGGMTSSMDLAKSAGIAAGSSGVDLCCCTGAGMRFLVRMCGVGRMIGVDATPAVIDLGRRRNAEEGLADRIDFVQADVCRTGLPAGQADFVWGEDAWCYVADKSALIAEAVRLVRPGGTIAFTDWVEGPTPMSDQEAQRLLRFMKFPSLASLQDYQALLETHGCAVTTRFTGRFASHVDLYLDMLTMQLTYDALRIIGFDQSLMQHLAGEMQFLQMLAHAGKIEQGLVVATKSEG